MASDRSLLRDALAQRGGGGAAPPPESTDTTSNDPLPDHEEDAPLKRKDPDTDADTSADTKRVRHDTMDDEWAEFQRTVVAPANEAPTTKYEHATISADPELNSAPQSDTPHEQSETQAEQRARLDREAREEALARIEDEQRAQEDADERVQLLRARLARIKQARQRRAAHAPSEA
ncbi:hypothetical protein MCAP1_002685 [Malassezia caprae]|uniref:Uncharacterized protein n=1 Tax=Malassezia caprae TaxID=1381934 RepID=A0AAF0E8W0_9BASI|nr:hypothetical protein MCAP1_002685 [Malassezia caprae]